MGRRQQTDRDPALTNVHPIPAGAARLRVALTQSQTEGWPPFETEVLAGEAVETSRRYRVVSIPWYAYGLHRGDLVETSVVEDGADADVQVARVVDRGGHATFRFRLVDEEGGEDELSAFLKILAGLACTYEAIEPRFYAVDAPDDAAREMLREMFTFARAENSLEFEEG